MTKDHTFTVQLSMANVRPVSADVQADVLREHFSLDQISTRFSIPTVPLEIDLQAQAKEDRWLAGAARRRARRDAKNGAKQ